ncbi:hypothetical protein Nepgr_033924 [Nepenthes gracilis]|uniref:Uncharacterized protein n=1 Tax=Nepenthes gracilis TaxID=150966 RepID=A0AAD3TM10_NEPGR|nr:hypothetical protein Nepgr_033924 [Nepenthes gracilis]
MTADKLPIKGNLHDGVSFKMKLARRGGHWESRDHLLFKYAKIAMGKTMLANAQEAILMLHYILQHFNDNAQIGTRVACALPSCHINSKAG